LSAILWGTQSSAPSYWTLGAFLRQDWLFWLVMAACFARKRWFAMAGASMVYAGLLRVFPGLCVIGWLTVAGIHLVKYRRMAPDHKRALFGGVLAAAILIPASLWAAGPRSYQQFFHHTIGVHDQTPLTNHMGLRVMIGHGVGSDWTSGRMKYTKDTKLTDPFESWKTKRLERYKKYKPLGYALMAGTFVLLLAAHRRMKSLWVAQCLGQIWIVLLSQLTCYYYSFMILLAPLTRVHRQLEVPILLWAALSQITWMMFYWNDDKYSALTWISTAMIYAVNAWFLPRGVLERVRGAFGGGKPTAPAARSSSGSTASSGSTCPARASST